MRPPKAALHLPLSDRMDEVAARIMQQAILPPDAIVDALHIACACAHTTTTLERPDSLGRWIFSIDNGGSSWDVVWIGRSWPSGSDGYLDMSERR